MALSQGRRHPVQELSSEDSGVPAAGRVDRQHAAADYDDHNDNDDANDANDDNDDDDDHLQSR